MAASRPSWIFFKFQNDEHHPLTVDHHNPEYEKDCMNSFGCAAVHTQKVHIFRRKSAASRPSWIFSKFRKDVHHPLMMCNHNPEYEKDCMKGFGCAAVHTPKVHIFR